MNANIRLSRISHPRATLFGFMLLILVFATFGVWAEYNLADAQTTLPPIAINVDTPSQMGWLDQLMANFK